MIDLATYRPGELVTCPNLITVEGTAQSGKGTCGAEVAEALGRMGRSVLVIDQGQKFRTLALLAGQERVDLADEIALLTFLEAEQTRERMLNVLGKVALMPAADKKNLLYKPQLHTASSIVARQEQAHTLAVGLLYDQVQEARDNHTDTVLIDGRAIEQYANDMHARQLGLKVLGFYFRCDALPAARRSLGDFRPWEDLSEKERIVLGSEVNKMFARNARDMKRDTNRMVFPSQAYGLDMMAGLPDDPDERLDVIAEIMTTGRVVADTSYVDIPHMTKPVVGIAQDVVGVADALRDEWNQFSRLVAAGVAPTE